MKVWSVIGSLDSVHADAGLLHHVRVLCRLGGEEGRELRGRCDEGVVAGRQVDRLQVGIGQHGLDVGTQALGYLDRPAAQADSFRDGAFCPADLFVATAGGGWRFAGREDTLLKISGRWVNLNELEERLGAGLPGLVESAAARVADADGIDALAYFYVAREGQQAAVEQGLRQRIETLPHYQRPRWLHPVDAIPRTATGKLLRRKLAEAMGSSA